MKRLSLGLFTLLFLFSCTSEEQPVVTIKSDPSIGQSAQSPLLTSLTPEETSITFTNQINEREGENYILNDNMYQGAGVALGDINNDGLLDVFMCGNQVSDRLYLNQGDMKFKDISLSAGILDELTWSMGATMADVNADGHLDIYITKHYFKEDDKRRNKLFINNGDATFTERSKEYGLDDPGYSIQANFFDMDGDGDLDVYVANQPPTWRTLRHRPENRSNPMFSDNLYVNDGGKFRMVTVESGVRNFIYSLNVSTSDFDRDGDIDIYVPADYFGADKLYLNDGTGKFTNASDKALRHMSNFSMGSDAADINNDGLLDFITADMVAEDNYRSKTNMSGMNPEKFWKLASDGYHYQYMFNALQVNNGDGTFSEVGQLAGTATTDWSWSPLFADLDNDGFKDLTMTNGLIRDVRNKDYHKKRNKYTETINGQAAISSTSKLMPLIEIAPSVRIKNYAYRNLGNLNFEKKDDDWGFNHAGWTQGSAYGDLDNDGDIDLVTSNMNEPASVYRNNASARGSGFVRFKLASKSNRSVRNSCIKLYAEGKMQFGELSSIRGYMSQSEEMIHFGVGDSKGIDSVVVQWINGSKSVLNDIVLNSTQTLYIEDASGKWSTIKENTIFEKANVGIDFVYNDNEFDDYELEVLLPHRMSHLGPHMSKADINGDKSDDLYIGGALGMSGALYRSRGNSYEKVPGPWSKYANQEELGSCFFDADGDNDLDLYVATGGNENNSAAMYRDHLYINQGGRFTEGKLPNIETSNGSVIAGDYDNDGDMDLFVGGRQTPRKYPFPTSSHLLRNDNGSFTEVSEEIAPALKNIGMVTDAVWLDHDGDKDLDLILTGEWMPITILENGNGKFTNSTEAMGLANTSGWWNTLEVGDMDNDGDLDIIAGNLGLNIKYKASETEPFRVNSMDFDENGTNDIVLSYYDQGKLFPVRGRQCSSEQMPFITEKFPTYHDFAIATVDQVLSENIGESLELEAKTFSSSFLENTGTGFTVSPLPIEAQYSTVSGIVVHDVNGDGNLDLIIGGNYYEREVETTRSDASIGYVLLGNGKGSFNTVHPSKTGLSLFKDVRDIQLLSTPQGLKLFAAVNGDVIEVYSLANGTAGN